jgi:hypothetical protein
MIEPLLQSVHSQDTLTGKLLDSVVVESPLPDPLIPFVQFLFQQPGWLMAGGLVVGAMLALAVAVALWKRRSAIGRWFGTQERGVTLLFVGTAAVLLLLLVGGGLAAHDYVMNDNDFCRGCHIFVPSGQAFVRPDTGTYLLVNKVEGPHDSLSCHSCHPFDLATQSRELFFWIADRPEQVPPHAKVPRDICEQCHVQGDARETWERVASTAGHRVHLESDSSALRKVECLTCHARTAHRFQPVDTTCAQQGCHLTDDVRIRLGAMAARFAPTNRDPNEEQLYCNSCHQFTAEAQFVTMDSAAGTLRPGEGQCLGCHEMRALLANFDVEKDPHAGSCGMCHNPHEDVKPAAALKSCADAGCHANWRSVPFHVGAAHRRGAQRCETCHQPHAARVDASDCTGCHAEVRKGGGKIQPPMPFDTTEALRRRAGLIEPGRARGQGDAAPPDDPPGEAPISAASPSDTFSHERHRRIACITCHTTTSPTATLTFTPPRGCQICHHQSPARSECSQCHQAGEVTRPMPVTVQVAVPEHQLRPREVGFEHDEHAQLTCIQCHTTAVSLEPEEAVATCAACHDEHHAARQQCASCHRTDGVMAAHQPPVDAHQACDQCHTSTTVGVLEPTRAFCLACHGSEVDHYQQRECSTCHLQATPEQYRPRLTGARP